MVTDAGSGIGASTAERFARRGANVVLAGRTRATPGRVAGALAPERRLVQEADVSDLTAVEARVAAASGASSARRSKATAPPL